jgi:hypothetical protein
VQRDEVEPRKLRRLGIDDIPGQVAQIGEPARGSALGRLPDVRRAHVDANKITVGVGGRQDIGRKSGPAADLAIRESSVQIRAGQPIEGTYVIQMRRSLHVMKVRRILQGC